MPRMPRPATWLLHTAALAILAGDQRGRAETSVADLVARYEEAAAELVGRKDSVWGASNTAVEVCRAIAEARRTSLRTPEAFAQIYRPNLGRLPSSGDDIAPPRLRKVAISFFGLTRSLSKTLCNLVENVFDPLVAAGIEYDVFVHSYALSELRQSTKNKVEGHGEALEAGAWHLLPQLRALRIERQLDVERELDTSLLKPSLQAVQDCRVQTLGNGKADHCCLPEPEFQRFQFCHFKGYELPARSAKELRSLYPSDEAMCADRSYREARPGETCCNLRQKLSSGSSKGTAYGWGSCPKEHEAPLRNVMLQYHSLREVGRLVEAAGEDYDLVLFLRPDVAYLGPLDVGELAIVKEFSARTGKEAAAFPMWGHSGGLNDRFAFGTPGAMAVYANRLDKANRYVRYQDQGLKPEKFLLHLMSGTGIPDDSGEVSSAAEEQLALFWSGMAFVRVRSGCAGPTTSAFAGCFVATQDCSYFPFLGNQDPTQLFFPAKNQPVFDGRRRHASALLPLPADLADKTQVLCYQAPTAGTRKVDLTQSVTPATAPLILAWTERNKVKVKQAFEPSVVNALEAMSSLGDEVVRRGVCFHFMELARAQGWATPLCLSQAFDARAQRRCLDAGVHHDFSKAQFPPVAWQLEAPRLAKLADVAAADADRAFHKYCCRKDLYAGA